MPLSIEALTTAALSAALDGATRTHAATAANIANANTPEYVPIRVSFDAHLQEAREFLGEPVVVDASMLDALRGSVEAAAESGGEGAVQVDVEMSELARNSVRFQALTQALSRHLGLLALAAADGRR